MNQKKFGKEYFCIDNRLKFEGEFLNGKRHEKGKNIIMVN